MNLEKEKSLKNRRTRVLHYRKKRKKNMKLLKYTVDRKTFEELRGNVVAPKFQRNFVWKPKARKQLIKSLKDGLPIGAFLLRALKNGKYDIIDGRQRFSTLLDYKKNTADYIDDEDVNENDLLSIINKIKSAKEYYEALSQSSQRKLLKDIKTNAVRNFKDKKAEVEDIKFEIVEYIKSKMSLTGAETLKLLNKEIANYVNQIRNLLDMSSFILPCIIFNDNATDDDIVNTFIAINTKGTRLSKYDLYSASWQDKLKVVDDYEIIEKVISKYRDSLENNQNIETNGFDEAAIRSTKEINVFEYAYALSKLIGDKCNKIYKIGDVSEVDSLAFSLLAGILGIPSKNMFDLGDKIMSINLVDLKNKIIETAYEVQNKLEDYCISPDKKEHFDHTFNQLASYIITAFKTKYAITEDGCIIELHNKMLLDTFYRNLPMWYLYDNLRDYWVGSGDTKLDSLVILDNITTSRYFQKVPKESFEATLNEWFKELNNEKNDTLTPQTKLFITYLINKKCPEPINTLDFEHIVTQEKLKELSERSGRVVLGVSSPANITLLPSFDNRSKREHTYYELVKLRDGSALSYDASKLDKYLYPTKEKLEFVESTLSFDMEAYERFKKNRSNQLINLFLNGVYQ